MKRYFVWVMVFWGIGVLSSQHMTLRTDVNTDSFPQVHFVVNVFNPEPLKKEAFELEEGGKKLDFELKLLPNQDDGTIRSKAVLFLVEDMTHPDHAGQRKTFKYILQNSLAKALSEGDSAGVAYFDRNRDGNTPLRFLTPHFTSDAALLSEKIKDYHPASDRFNRQKSSDLYNAIYDGILYLAKYFPGKTKVLVVLSSGKNLELSNYNSIGDLILLARKNHVGIYSIQYMVYEHENIDMLAGETGGKIFHVEGPYPIAGDHSKETAADSLSAFMQKAVMRLSGRNYRISYQSALVRDGKIHTVVLKTLGESLNIPVKVPACNLICLIKKYPYRSSGIGGGTLLLLAGLIMLVRRKRKRKIKAKLEKEQRLLEQMKRQQLALEEQKKRTEEIKRQAALEKQRREEEIKRVQREKERQMLIEAMKKSGGFPKLKIFYPDKTEEFVINEPQITAGRAPSNKLILDSRYVSAKHFIIYFRHGDYFIKDFGSSNGTIVNGRKVTEKKLQRNDAIQIGNVKILFLK